MQRLPTRTATRVNHDLSRLDLEQRRDVLGRGVLNLEEAVAEGGRVAEFAALLQAQRVRQAGNFLGFDALQGEVCLQRVGGRVKRIHAQKNIGGLVEGREQARPFCAILLGSEFKQPVGDRCANREGKFVNRASLRAGRRRLVPRPIRVPQRLQALVRDGFGQQTLGIRQPREVPVQPPPAHILVNTLREQPTIARAPLAIGLEAPVHGLLRMLLTDEDVADGSDDLRSDVGVQSHRNEE